MRRCRDGGTGLLWLTAVVFLSLSVLPARAQVVPQYSPHGAVLHLDPDAVRQQMTSSRDALVDVNNETTIIKYFHTLAGTRTTEEQDQIVSEMTDYAIGRGLRPSPDIAEAFLSLGLDAKTRGKWAEYKRMARYAESFDPDLPSIHLALAETARHHDGIFSGEYIFETLAAFFTSFRNIETRWIALSNLLIWLRITFFILLGVISLLLLLKYQALLRHDVKEWLGGGDSKWIEVAGWVAVFLPSLLLLSGYWWIIYWAGIFLLYARWSERIVTVVVVLLFATVSALAFFCLQRLYLDQAPPNVSNVRCYANRIDAGLDAYLANHTSPKDPLERNYSFLLAGRYMLHGSYLKAENLYRNLLKESPDDARVANNLGCIYFYENRYQEAIQQFTHAIAHQSDMSVAYLNRAMARNKVFNFTGAQEDQEKARKLDSHLFDTYKLNQSEEWSPFPSWLSLDRTRDMAIQVEQQKPRFLKSVIWPASSRVSLIFDPPFSLWALIFMVVFLSLAIIKKADFFARSCFKCGQPFCSRCKTSLEFESFCSQCVHLYIKQDGVSPEARLKKNYEVDHHHTFQRIQRVIFSLVAPGSTHFLASRPFSALFLLFLWCGIVGGLVMKPFLMPFSFPVAIHAQPLSTVFFLVAAALAVLLWGLFGIPSAVRQPAARAPGGAKG
jgi:hypothetical protein